MWNHKADGATGERRAFVSEGNVPLYVFTENSTKVRFLTEDITTEDVMVEYKCVREQAEEIISTKLIHEKWIQPIARWEHQIKEIPGKRFFSSIVCQGRNVCPLCAENEQARAQGINENKMLPYPVRKRFYVPAWFYDLGRVLFIRGSEEFFDDVATYVNKYGSNCDFEIFKSGRGLNTKYKVVFSGESDPNSMPPVEVMAPNQLDFTLDPEEFNRRLEGGRGAQRQETQSFNVPSSPGPVTAVPTTPVSVRVSQPAVPISPVASAVPAPGAGPVTPDPSMARFTVPPQSSGFMIPFGTHKGQTFQQLLDTGEADYIHFLAKNGAGEVQKQAVDFLKSAGLM